MEMHMYCDEDDGTLCEKACSGCEEAFTALFHRHYDSVHAFVYRICLDVTGAEDITQEAFIKAARALPSFRRQASFKCWLFRIAMNATHDWSRRKIRENHAASELAAVSRDSVCERVADLEPVGIALASLPEEMRHAVVLIYYEGMNHAQAATILGCAETTVSWRVFRAKRKLKTLLSDNAGKDRHE